MSKPDIQEKTLIEKIRRLPPEKIIEVEDFVEFLRLRVEDQKLTQTFTKLSEDTFRMVWDNPEDEDYDRL